MRIREWLSRQIKGTKSLRQEHAVRNRKASVVGWEKGNAGHIGLGGVWEDFSFYFE